MYQTKFLTSWSLKSVWIFSLILVISSCGFHPLYASKEKQGYKSCNNFSVSEIKGFNVSGQKLRYKLQDALNQVCVNRDTNYTVNIDLTSSKSGTAIQKNTEITRYNLNLVGTYKVTNSTTGKIAADGTSTMVGGFDTVASDFGTYAIEQDTERKLIEEMANDLTLKISSQLLRKNKKDESSASKN